MLQTEGKWLPKHLNGIQKITLNYADRKVLKRKIQIPVSEWAEKYRIVPMDGALPGPWRNSTTPYTVGVMDASFYKSVQQIILCWPPQCGKSDCVNNCIGYASDRMPGNVLYVYPDELTARENNRDRITPMFNDSPQLKKYLSGYQDDQAALCLRLKHMKIYMAWSNSASRLGNKPLPYVVLDEEDKYPVTANKKEASPADLAKKRSRTFAHMRKIWRMSTPTTEDGPIWKALTQEAEIVFVYWVRCPSCSAWQLMEWKQIKWPEGERDPRKVESGKLAWYECNACGSKWDDATRNLAVRAGEWRCKETDQPLFEALKERNPVSIGFHLKSFASPFVSLSEDVAAFLWGMRDKNRLKDFRNAHEAEPWVNYHQEKSEDAILALCDDRPRGMVPGGSQVAGMTAGVDTQDDGFWYEIRAWGHGMTRDSWQIREGFVTSLESLAHVLWKDEYCDPDGKKYLVNMACIDAMGHRTSEVYDFCRSNPGRIAPTRGERNMRQPFVWTRIDNYPGTNKAIPGGLQLLRVNTTYFKNDLSSMMAIALADPGSWKLHSETTQEWAIQMTAEYLNDAGIWECMPGRANHAWDCSVLTIVASDVLGIRFWGKKTVPAETDKPRIAERRPFHTPQKQYSRW